MDHFERYLRTEGRYEIHDVELDPYWSLNYNDFPGAPWESDETWASWEMDELHRAAIRWTVSRMKIPEKVLPRHIVRSIYDLGNPDYGLFDQTPAKHLLILPSQRHVDRLAWLARTFYETSFKQLIDPKELKSPNVFLERPVVIPKFFRAGVSIVPLLPKEPVYITIYTGGAEIDQHIHNRLCEYVHQYNGHLVYIDDDASRWMNPKADFVRDGNEDYYRMNPQCAKPSRKEQKTKGR